jgi:hypothetical protein
MLRFPLCLLTSSEHPFCESASSGRLSLEVGPAERTRIELIEAGVTQEVVAHLASEGVGRRLSGANDAVQSVDLKQLKRMCVFLY